MNQARLKPYPNTNFICDNCQGEFSNETAYSSASNLDDEERYPTYCVNCVEPFKKTSNKSKKTKN